jgi:hypothetical protein
MSRKRFTKSQLEALKYLISKSRDLSEFARRFCVWMVEESRDLSRNVYVEIPANFSLKKEVGHGVHNICSEGLTTHMDEILQAMGTPKVFSFEGFNDSYRVYFSTYACDQRAQQISFDFEAITNIRPWPPEIKRAQLYRKKKGE